MVINIKTETGITINRYFLQCLFHPSDRQINKKLFFRLLAAYTHQRISCEARIAEYLFFVIIECPEALAAVNSAAYFNPVKLSIR